MNECDGLRFILSAPFRTNIEMDTFSALAEGEADGHIGDVVNALNLAEKGGSQWMTGRGSGGRGDLWYSRLDEHVLPGKSQPIARLQVECADVRRISEGAPLPAGASDFEIEECGVRYYDDTIAILVCRVRLLCLGEDDVGDVLDSWSAEFCKLLINNLGNWRRRLENRLRKGDENGGRLFSEPRELRRFHDRNGNPERGGDGEADRDGSGKVGQDGETMLWVNRVLVAGSRPSGEAVKAWTQTDPESADWLDLKSMSLLPCVGNNILAGPLCERDVGVTVEAISLCTFFYVSQDLFRRRLKDLHLKVARACRSRRRRRPKAGRFSRLPATAARALRGLLRNPLSEEAVGELRDHVVVMQGEFGDCRLGLQGHLREASSRFLKAWNYDALAAAVERKSASLETTWSLLREKRRRKYDGALQFALTIIAGFALMQFLLALLVASGSGILGEDSVSGPIDAVSQLPPDGTLNIGLLLVCCLSLLVFWSRK